MPSGRVREAGDEIFWVRRQKGFGRIEGLNACAGQGLGSGRAQHKVVSYGPRGLTLPAKTGTKPEPKRPNAVAEKRGRNQLEVPYGVHRNAGKER